MRVNPSDKSITYKLEDLANAEEGLAEIEKTVLENDDVDGDIARSICSELNLVRESLGLKRGVQRHKKWAPELQNET